MKMIPLTQGKFAKVDDQDYDWLIKQRWCAMVCGGKYYATSASHKPRVKMHRAIMNAPTGMFVDHINGDGLDNRRSNLRVCTKAENVRNSGRSRRNTSGYKGVSWEKVCSKWRADIVFKGRKYTIGFFHDPAEAARAYDRKARELFGPYARLNLPEG